MQRFAIQLPSIGPSTLGGLRAPLHLVGVCVVGAACTGGTAYPAPISAPHHGPHAVASDPAAEPPPLWTLADRKRIRSVQGSVDAAASEHGVEPSLINGVIWVESRFRAEARGRLGPRGLMQIMPRTGRALAREMGRRYQPYDPDFNVSAGTYYLARMMRRYRGNHHLALAAYNRGPGRVDRRLREGRPMPDGVRRYIARVLGAMRAFQRRSL